MSGRLCLIAALLCLTATGCFTVGRVTEGNPVAWEAVDTLEVGTHTVADVIGALGSPLEYHRHPDGMLLVYRSRRYNYWRMGVEPDLLLSFAAVDRATSSVLENLRLVVETGDEFEDRVAAYFDRSGVLAAVGTHRRGEE
jgi:hypothetical protein